MVTLHSKISLSSTKPAEKPSTGFLQRSANERKKKFQIGNKIVFLNEYIENWIATFELFLKEEVCLSR